MTTGPDPSWFEELLKELLTDDPVHAGEAAANLRPAIP
jgi:hypothetical protein